MEMQVEKRGRGRPKLTPEQKARANLQAQLNKAERETRNNSVIKILDSGPGSDKEPEVDSSFDFSVGIYRVNDEVPIPTYGTSESACFDLRFCSKGKFDYIVYRQDLTQRTRQFVNGSAIIGPHETAMLPTGFIFDVPLDYSLRVFSRSGIALKRGLIIVNGVGVVDHDYVNETMLLVHNLTEVHQTIENEERLAQAEFIQLNRVKQFNLLSTPPLQKTDRMGGFGSTGVK